MVFWVTVSQPEEFFQLCCGQVHGPVQEHLIIDVDVDGAKGRDSARLLPSYSVLPPFLNCVAIRLNTSVTYLHIGYPISHIGLGVPPGQGLILTAPETIPLAILSPSPISQGLTWSLLYPHPSTSDFLVWTRWGVRHAFWMAQRLILTFSIWRTTYYIKESSVIQERIIFYKYGR